MSLAGDHHMKVLYFSKMTPGNETLSHCLHFRFRRPPQGDYRWIFVGFLSG